METSRANAGKIDAGQTLDNAPLSSYQIKVLLTATIVMVLEGIDIQCINSVAPTIVEDWVLT